MNTGIQRSGATPFGASTTTTPAGSVSLGKLQQRKDMTAIAVAHNVPFVGQAAASHWYDLSRKVEAAVAAGGPAFLNVLSDCPVGWGHEPSLFKTVLDLAVETRLWPLYEVVDGNYRVTHVPKERVPVSEWFGLQTRFAHLSKPEAKELVAEIQRRVDSDWERLLRRASSDAAAAGASVSAASAA